MNRIPQQKWRTLTAIVALTLMAAVLLLWSSDIGSHAQQESNRQLVQTGPTNPSIGKRIALVIGNGAYTNAPPLRNPPNDARDMAATLKTLGFDVTSGINVDQRDFKRLIREFGQKLKAGGSGLFYYAGHGVQSKGRNYLIPVDADIQSEAEVDDSGVDVSLVLNFMDDAQNGLNFVILDACRNNPFLRSFRSASDGLAQVDAPTGTLIAYATAPGRVASDGPGQNGLYTSELLKQMRVPGLSATEMFMRVRAEVIKQTGSKQVPWEASSLVGAFYFTAAPKNTLGTQTSAAANETKIDPAAVEREYWETIRSSTTPQDYRDYLVSYPNGAYAGIAKTKLRQFEEAKNTPANTTGNPSKTASRPSTTLVRNVSAPAINCVFNPSCTVTVQDSSDNIPMSTGGTGLLKTRTYIGAVGAPAAGLYAYQYLLDLRNAVGTSGISCIDWMSISFGPVVSTLNYGGDVNPDQVFVVTGGGIGTIGIASTDQTGSNIRFNFSSPICEGGAPGKGDSSYFWGLVSKTPPTFVSATLHETGGVNHAVKARAPK